jgi:hypothetical protein
MRSMVEGAHHLSGPRAPPTTSLGLAVPLPVPGRIGS